jgi:hypothetical protein
MNVEQCYEALNDDVDTWIAFKTGDPLTLFQRTALEIAWLVSRGQGKMFAKARLPALGLPPAMAKKILGLVLMNKAEEDDFFFVTSYKWYFFKSHQDRTKANNIIDFYNLYDRWE